MKQVKLQNIIFPSPDICTMEDMYFRRCGGTEYSWAQNCIVLKKNSSVYFDTYFNGISIGKWRKYTNVSDIYVTLRFKGILRVTLIRKERVGHEVLEHYIGEKIIESEGEEVTLKYNDAYSNGMYTFGIFAMRPVSFYGGYYWTEVEENKVRDAKLALNICTFKREDFVKKNINILQKEIYESSEYKEFKKDLEVFIIDNAKTLRAEDFSQEFVHMFPNKNVGGAGGFTRGLLEIKRMEKEKGFTHALLMDDDIVLNPETIFRTWVLLSLLKEEYKDAFVGGAMLRLDRQSIQVESGAVWNQGELLSRKSGLDLREIEPCLYNEVEEKVDYTAWWYTALPLSVVRDNNLPLPIFIRGDDVEYGLRNARRIILMNGICVWHEPFENKYSSSMYYYILRNRLLDNAIHNMPLAKKQFLDILHQWVFGEIYLYRYKNAKLLLQGVKDYLNGVDWLKKQDGAEINQKVMEQGYKMQYMEDIGARFDYGMYESALCESVNTSLRHRIIKRLTLNGIKLKPKRQSVIIPVVGCKEISVYRTENVIHYDAATQKGFITRRDVQEAEDCRKQYMQVKTLICEKYEQINREYLERGRELMEMEFWYQYLED